MPNKYKTYMDKNYFSSLNKSQKTDFLWAYGEIINELKTPKTYNSLFLLHNFYVEVHLDKLNNEIKTIFVQEDPGQLYKFIAKLNLKELQEY